jgi:hypothetical protein
MITNTLNHYEIQRSFSADEIMGIFKNNKLLHLAELATDKGDLKNLTSVIDLGSKPLSSVLGPEFGGRVGDKQNNEDLEKAPKNKKKKKSKPFSDLIFLPPRPTKNLEVVTFAECSPKFIFRNDQLPEPKM